MVTSQNIGRAWFRHLSHPNGPSFALCSVRTRWHGNLRRVVPHLCDADQQVPLRGEVEDYPRVNARIERFLHQLHHHAQRGRGTESQDLDNIWMTQSVVKKALFPAGDTTTEVESFVHGGPSISDGFRFGMLA